MNAEGFLEHMARSDEMLDHEDGCGMCHYMRLGADVAREMIKQGTHEDIIAKWSEEQRRRWEDSKFFKLWQEEKTAGRDPNKAFAAKGWEP